jgi:hypothetical protein
MEERKEKHLSDLEKMTAERKKAEAEYLESQQNMLNVRRILREGIANVEDLIQYLVACIEDAKHMEDLARERNNAILYSETVGIRREFVKLLKLVLMDGTASPPEEVDGTEEAHRAKNEGEESYQ